MLLSSFRLSERTYSLWGFLSNHLNEFLNPLYKRDSEGIMHPSATPQSIKYAFLIISCFV